MNGLTNLFRLLPLAFLFLLACEEIPPVVTPLEGGQVRDTLLQNILVEEFTGARCVNCPAGSSELARLQGVYGDQLIIVAIHAGSFARPYPESREDFRTSEGDALLNYLGQPLGYPSAIINRKLYDGEVDLQLSRSLWPLFLQQESERLATMELAPRVRYDSTSREVTYNLDLTLLEGNLSSDVRLSLMVVEDNVADLQLTPDGPDEQYVHRHNLRDMLTAATGNSLPDDWEVGQAISRQFTYQLPSDWKQENVSLVAVVHENGERKDVLAVNKTPLR
jgi:hypothetical protein